MWDDIGYYKEKNGDKLSDAGRNGEWALKEALKARS